MSFDPAAAAAWMEAVGVSRVTPFRELLIAVSNPSTPGKSEMFSQTKLARCGWTQPKLEQLFDQLRDENLFYPDYEEARAYAESFRRYYSVNTAFSPEQVDRQIDHLTYQFSAPRKRNLNASQLSLAVSLAIKSM